MLIALPIRSGKVVPITLDRGGKRVRRLGNSGSGPGEYEGPTQILRWVKDSVLVVDPSTNRISVLDPRLKYVRTLQGQAQATGIEALVALTSGEIVANAAQSTRSALGYPLHVYTKDGVLSRSFGADTPVVRYDRPLEHVRFLASDGRRLWSLPMFGKYEIEEWDPSTGRGVQKIVRETKEFPVSTEVTVPSPTQPPSPAGVGLFFDAGILWVLIRVPDKEWKKGINNKSVAGENGVGAVHNVVDKNKLYDTRVEAFDATTGVLLASARFDEDMVVFFSQGQIATTTREQPDGSIVTELFTFTLAGRR